MRGHGVQLTWRGGVMESAKEKIVFFQRKLIRARRIEPRLDKDQLSSTRSKSFGRPLHAGTFGLRGGGRNLGAP